MREVGGKVTEIAIATVLNGRDTLGRVVRRLTNSPSSGGTVIATEKETATEIAIPTAAEIDP
ncbi:hypothetical protein A1O7_06487 [Cladophialophora yegresii CBS 114405]|uniref:Uncharacterized protein n=1 Tax=Cladophialophora yegresii CBS 114405 TaxID=1182544 RepID=W9W3E2_9EURO|nr:uncharacterized protein A1O7_06487 [Cladophialophora yegresii CBS 114405]EXJ59056.1 hypothetical protein A1O7_06487 [Cladophialophora yegresii CBS 114405]